MRRQITRDSKRVKPGVLYGLRGQNSGQNSEQRKCMRDDACTRESEMVYAGMYPREVAGINPREYAEIHGNESAGYVGMNARADYVGLNEG